MQQPLILKQTTQPILSVVETPEIQHIDEPQTKEYRETSKFNDWVRYYTQPIEKETYGNKTQSTIKAYNLNPKTQYASASTIGWENFRKLEYLASNYLETKGLTFQALMDIGVSKMVKSDNPRWYEIIMELAKYKQDKFTQVIPTGNTQVNVYNLGSEEVEDFNKKFLKFLETQ